MKWILFSRFYLLFVWCCVCVCTCVHVQARGGIGCLPQPCHHRQAVYWLSQLSPAEGVWRERGFLHVCRICVGLHIKCPTVARLARSHSPISFWLLAASLHWSRICSWPFVDGSLWTVKRHHLAKCQVIKKIKIITFSLCYGILVGKFGVTLIIRVISLDV